MKPSQYSPGRLVALCILNFICIVALYFVLQDSRAILWSLGGAFVVAVGLSLLARGLNLTNDQRRVRNDNDQRKVRNDAEDVHSPNYSKLWCANQWLLAFTQFCLAIWLCHDLSQFSWPVVVGIVAALTVAFFSIAKLLEPTLSISSRVFTLSCLVSMTFVCASGFESLWANHVDDGVKFQIENRTQEELARVAIGASRNYRHVVEDIAPGAVSKTFQQPSRIVRYRNWLVVIGEQRSELTIDEALEPGNYIVTVSKPDQHQKPVLTVRQKSAQNL